MKTYLSFGGGVNSVAMYLLMLEQKVEFEAIFVDHGTDYPETYDYLDMFRKKYPVTVLKPKLGILYDYLMKYKIIPSIQHRYCTEKFKVTPIYDYIQTPCFMLIGIDAGESKRAKITSEKGVENRWPLIEAGIDREGCKQLIIDAGLPVPRKSGCYICPFQSNYQWKRLRREYPDLFCKAQQLENKSGERRRKIGKKEITIIHGMKLSSVIEEKQGRLFKEDEFPPCYCGY